MIHRGWRVYEPDKVIIVYRLGQHVWVDHPYPGEDQDRYPLDAHAAYKFFPRRPRLREAGEQAVDRRCKHNAGLMFG